MLSPVFPWSTINYLFIKILTVPLLPDLLLIISENVNIPLLLDVGTTNPLSPCPPRIQLWKYRFQPLFMNILYVISFILVAESINFKYLSKNIDFLLLPDLPDRCQFLARLPRRPGVQASFARVQGQLGSDVQCCRSPELEWDAQYQVQGSDCELSAGNLDNTWFYFLKKKKKKNFTIPTYEWINCIFLSLKKVKLFFPVLFLY